MVFENTVGYRVLQLRKELKMNQTKFAECCDMSRTAISKIENNAHEISSQSLNKIAKACNVTTDYILYGDSYSSTERVDCMLYSDREFIKKYLKLKPEDKKIIMKMLELLHPEVCG